jgi:hypothetical protein
MVQIDNLSFGFSVIKTSIVTKLVKHMLLHIVLLDWIRQLLNN